MIGKAIKALLLANSAVSALVEGRIYAVQFGQGKIYPCISINTDSIQPIPVRDSTGVYGTLILELLTADYPDLESLTDAIRAAMDNYNGIIAGYALNIEPGIESSGDEATELEAFYKTIEFEITATKQ